MHNVHDTLLGLEEDKMLQIGAPLKPLYGLMNLYLKTEHWADETILYM